MPDSPIQHVADTAFWVATYRADESRRPDALFSDPLAERLVEGRGRAIADRMSGAAFTSWILVIRTRIIDDYVMAAVADGFDTVLNLGAGLDTRPYRMELPASLRWIEVDFDATISFKEERLAGEVPHCRLERRRVDLTDPAARRALLSDVDNLGKRVLVLTEGVVPYLSNSQVADLADDLARCAHFERWVLEYLGSRGAGLRSLLSRGRKRQLARAPFQFAPSNWHVFFASHGWTAHEIRYVAIEGERLGRTPPLPTWMRIVMRALPDAIRNAARRHYGYAVLERAG